MKQEGHCAFSKSCVNTNAPHVRLPLTNRTFCTPHFHLVEISSAVHSESSDTSARIVVRRQSGGSRNWPTFAGIMSEG